MVGRQRHVHRVRRGGQDGTVATADGPDPGGFLERRVRPGRSHGRPLEQRFGGLHVLVSSHILHEVDLISDQVVLLNGGYVVAEGAISVVRDEMEEEHPAQVLIRCNRPSLLASRVFEQDHVVEARIHEDGKGLLVRTRDADMDGDVRSLLRQLES